MKKILLTLTAAGVLAVPAGAAFAEDDTTVPSTTVPTCVPQRDRDRDRVYDQDGSMLQERARQQLRLHDGTCDSDCTGDQVRQQLRLHDGSGSGGQYRSGPA